MHSEKNDEVELKKYTDVACNNGFSPILFEIRFFYSLTDLFIDITLLKQLIDFQCLINICLIKSLLIEIYFFIYT